MGHCGGAGGGGDGGLCWSPGRRSLPSWSPSGRSLPSWSWLSGAPSLCLGGMHPLVWLKEKRLAIGENAGEVGVAGKGGEATDRDWLLFTAEDTAWAKRDGVAGE